MANLCAPVHVIMRYHVHGPAARNTACPYEVLSLIGAGGMGEVYRGRDTRLDRSVALKMLATPVSRRRWVRVGAGWDG